MPQGGRSTLAPAWKGHHQHDRATASAGPRVTRVGGPPRLLVVEDSESDVELLREALADSVPAVELDVVRHGEDALAFLRRQAPFPDAAHPDLVVLDLNLPRMGGLEVLKALREDVDPRLRRIPVVIFTTSGSTSDVETAYDLHASSFVTKPTAFEHYVETVCAFREFWLRAAALPATG
jgi:chemotaxis family two-component system response regulator Rcp1